MSRIVLALMWLIHWLPFRALAALGNGIGAVAFWLIPERRRVTRLNLQKCFPDLSATERVEPGAIQMPTERRHLRGVGSQNRLQRFGY